jgi:hypothetical protein
MEALFMLLFVLAVVVGLVWLGYVLASDKLAADRERPRSFRTAISGLF